MTTGTPAAPGVEIELTSGRVRGEAGEDGFAVFRGIPFAAPPVGELRFAPPQPVEPWKGVADATTYGPASIQGGRLPGREAPPRQGMFGGLFGAGDLDVSEDCLYLNVWTPGVDDARRPVMVWIHGGAFRMGTGGSPGYDGTALATRGDVVVVTLNYRLGMLGFLYAPEIGAANLGLLDQVAALEWVQREIAAFGGDPDQVTIFGESAGAKSVECLCAMPAAKGLFKRAIAQSTYGTLVEPEDAAQRTKALLDALGLADASDLRNVPLEKLVATEASLPMGLGAGVGGGGGPVRDAATLPIAPTEVFAAGNANAAEVIVGTTLDESRLFGAFGGGLDGLDDDALLTRMRASFGDDEKATKAIEVYRKERAAFGESEDAGDVLMAVQTDQMFRQHSIRVAEALASTQPSTYMYLFTWKSTALGGKLGACHGIEIPFVFGTLGAGMGQLAGDTPESQALAEAVMDAWLSFAKTGAPTSAGLPEWPAYDTARRATMILGAETRVTDAPLDAIRQFWQALPA